MILPFYVFNIISICWMFKNTLNFIVSYYARACQCGCDNNFLINMEYFSRLSPRLFFRGIPIDKRILRCYNVRYHIERKAGSYL